MAGAGDATFMRRAIDLASGQLGRTGDNPAVGCVIVKDGRISAEAATADGGRPHAEEQALALAGERARGAVAYLTLEPCAERSAGSPSCASRLIEAGVEAVFIACADASPLAGGRGPALLADAGIPVFAGFLEAEARQLYNGYAPSPERPG